MTVQESLGKILVCDDETEVRDLICKLLKRNGYDVVQAENGVEALKLLECTTVDAIVSDLSMPEMDGLTFVQEVRDRLNPLPIAILTGHPSKRKAIGSMRLGVIDFLDKSDSPSGLEQALVRLARKGAQFALAKRISSSRYKY